MENKEKKMTDPEAVPEKEPLAESQVKIPPATQVVDTDPEMVEVSQPEDETERPTPENTPERQEPRMVDSQAELPIITATPEPTIVDALPEMKREETARPQKKQQSAQVVPADKVQAEEVPTIPIGSLQSISALEPEVSVHSVASMRAVNIPAPLVVQPSEYRRGISEWLEAWQDGIRPAYLPLSLLPVILGSALAWTQSITEKNPLGHFTLVYFVLALLAAAILQIGAHLINDYYDHQRGIDTSNALGPGGLIQQGLIKPTRILIIGLALLGVGTIVGLIAATPGGPLVYLFGLIAVLSAYFFSATKKSLSSLGLGELVGLLVFGLIPTISAYMIQTGGKLTTTSFYYSLPLGFLAAATIYANNMRDIEGDSHVGKNTFVTLIGLRWSRIGYIVLMLAAYAIVVLLGTPHGHPHFILLALWTFPTLVVAITGVLRTEISAGFHNVMHQSLKIFRLFSMWLIIGLIISALIPVLPFLPIHLFKLP